MCLPCWTIVGSFPLLWVIFMPVVGAFCGPDTVLRFSLLMMVYASLESCVQRYLKTVIPLFSMGFFVVIICLPVSIVPFPLVWLYGHLVWLTEPLILLTEALGIVELTIYISKRLSEHIEDNALLAKGIMLGVTGLSYSLSFFLALYIYWTGSTAVRWLLFAVVLVSLVHLTLTIWLDQGIISNSAVVTLCMLGTLFVGSYETDLIQHPLSEPKEWLEESWDLKSLIQMLLSAAMTSMSHVTKATRFLYKLISPVLITLIMIRAASMLQIVYWLAGRLKEYILDDEDDGVEDEDYLEEVEIDEVCSCVPSGLPFLPLPAKLALIFVYTQLVYRTMSLSGGHFPFKAYLPISLHGALTGGGMLKDVGYLRIGQAFLFSVFYPLRLFGESKEDE